MPGRVGPVVPLPNVGADAGPSRRVRVKTRYLPAKGLEGTAHRLGAAEQLQQTHFRVAMTKATGRQRRPPARRPRRFVRATAFFMLHIQREQHGAATASHLRIGDSARRSDDQREGRQVRPPAPERRSAGVAVGGVAEDHLAPGRLQRPDRQARGSVPGARRGLHGAAPGDRAAPRQGPDGAVAF